MSNLQEEMEIRDLYVEVKGNRVLKGLNLQVREGERHILIGPNASGKSTLAFTIMGFPEYKIAQGEIRFRGELLNNLPIDKRAKMGITLAFQSPPKVNINFAEFIEEIEERFNHSADISEFARDIEHFKRRNLNDGFSGGEKKRSELVQILAMRPKFIILDEIDSGVDIDSLKLMSKVLDRRKESMLIISHYRHILDYLRVDKAHILGFGKILVSGKAQKILNGIERYGYKGYLKELGICKECPLKECVLIQ